MVIIVVTSLLRHTFLILPKINVKQGLQLPQYVSVHQLVLGLPMWLMFKVFSYTAAKKQSLSAEAQTQFLKSVLLLYFDGTEIYRSKFVNAFCYFNK